MTLPQRCLAAAALALLCGVLFFYDLGAVPFYSKGEPREALQVVESVDHGSWVLQLRNGNEIPSKPPLYHWLASLMAVARGQLTELEVRLPSAILATLTVLLTFWLGSRMWDPWAGLFAAVMLATSPKWLGTAREARVDMTLTACTILAFAAFEEFRARTSTARLPLFVFYVALALSTLTKGPVGFMLPLFVAVAYFALRGELGRLAEMQWKMGAVILLLMAGTWYALAIWLGGVPFLNKQLMFENITRFVGKSVGHVSHPHPFYYYIPSFLAGFMPWTLFLIPLAVFLWRERARLDADRYLYPLLWIALILVFYSASAGKRAVYILPIYPAAALLVGAWWSRLTREEMAGAGIYANVLRGIGYVLALLGVAAIVALTIHKLGMDLSGLIKPLLNHRDRANLPLLSEILRHRYWVVLAYLLPTAGAAIALATAARGRSWRVVFVAIAALVVPIATLSNSVLAVELSARRSLAPFAAEVKKLVPADEPLVFYEMFDYGTAYYLRRHVPRVHGALPASGGTTYLLVWEKDWDRLVQAASSAPQEMIRSSNKGEESESLMILARVDTSAPAPAPIPGS